MIFNESKYNCHWSTKRLDELGYFNRGKSKHRPRNDKRLFIGGKHPLIQTGDVKAANLFITSHSDTYNDFGLKQSKLWPTNTLCITIAANIAETAILSYPMCFPDSIVGFNAIEEECSEIFMHYIFTYIRASIQQRIQGSIQDNINIDYLTKLQFKIPPKNQRLKIESFLYSLDSKIELNNKINAELEAMAKLIYDYWFVQFDFPISKEQAQAMGKPELEDKPYRASGGKMVYNEELKREIPEGWEVKDLGALIEIQRGISYKSSEIKSEEGVPMINLNSFNLNGTYKESGIKTYSGKFTAKNIASPGDLLIAATDVTRNADIIGKSIIVPRYYKDQTLVFSMDIAKIIPSDVNLLPYLMMLFNSEYYHNYIKHFASGTLVLHLNMDGMMWFKTVIPPTFLLSRYADMFIPLTERITQSTVENKELASLRDWLLPMLMNGQVSIKEAEEQLSMAAEGSVGFGDSC